MADDLGALAVALSKAQGEFGPITRDKTVTVQKKTGGSYTFSYAPLDQIMNTVRGPLRDNGLTLTQIIDAEGLRTMLIHESGAYLQGVTPLPETSDVQAFGSAITYLRRYSVVSILGIATEEDDDGNRAAGNTTSPRSGGPGGRVHVPHEPQAATREQAASMEPVLIGPWSGTGKVVVRKSGPADGNLRQDPDGAYAIVAFATVDDKTIPQVLIRGAFAADLIDAAGSQLDGLVATIDGDLYSVPWDKDGKRMPPFQRLDLRHIQAEGGWSLPLPQQTGPGLFDAEAEGELDALL